MNVSNDNVQWCEFKMPKTSTFKEKYNCDQIVEMFDQNEMDQRECDEFVYSKGVFESSAVTEFDLVCDRNHLKASHRAHSALKLEKSEISKVQKNIICHFKNGKKSIFAPEKIPKIAFLLVLNIFLVQKLRFFCHF